MGDFRLRAFDQYERCGVGGYFEWSSLNLIDNLALGTIVFSREFFCL